MIYKFKDLVKGEIYDDSLVVIAVGPYNIFNNIVVDDLKSRCESEYKFKVDVDLLNEFNTSEDEELDIFESNGEDTDSVTINNNVNFETFLKCVRTPCLTGKWSCSVDFGALNAKQKEKVFEYIKNPSPHGKLAVVSSDFRDYRVFLKSRIVNDSLNINLFRLSYPDNNILKLIVNQLFEARNVLIEKSAVELFIVRMNKSYDDYEEIVDKIVSESVPKVVGVDSEQDPNWKYTITRNDTMNAMKGIENFILDDLISRLVKPLTDNEKDKIDDTDGGKVQNLKISRIYHSLMEEYGPEKLVSMLKKQIESYIEFRMVINQGIIPVLVRYSVPEAKERLRRIDENHPLLKYSDYMFRRMSITASMTSLADWYTIKMILNNTKYIHDKHSCERSLYSVVNRRKLTEYRLLNNTGFENVMSLDMRDLDNIRFDESRLMFN